MSRTLRLRLAFALVAASFALGLAGGFERENPGGYRIVLLYAGLPVLGAYFVLFTRNLNRLSEEEKSQVIEGGSYKHLPVTGALVALFILLGDAHARLALLAVGLALAAWSSVGRRSRLGAVGLPVAYLQRQRALDRLAFLAIGMIGLGLA
jgi:hypothetical protein